MLDPKYIPLFIGGFIAWICFMIFEMCIRDSHYVKDLQGPFDGTNYMAIGGVSPANIREFFDAEMCIRDRPSCTSRSAW